MKSIRGLLVSPGSFRGLAVKYEKGIPFSRYRGKVVVLRDLDSSEIIIKLSKPLGVISEVGGITAHGALLLREFKLPGMVVPNALSLLKSGTVVELTNQGILQVQRAAKTSAQPRRRAVLRRVGQWTMVKPRRPEDVFSVNTMSMATPGFIATGRVLLGKKMKSAVKYTKKGVWVKNHPLPDELAKKVLFDDAWFRRHVRAERRIFEQLKKWERQMKQRLSGGYSCTLRECFMHTLRCRRWFTAIRPYIYLFADAVEVLQRDFISLSEKFLGPTEAAQVYSLIGRSAYAKVIKKMNIREPRPAKGAMFSYQPFNLVSATPDVVREVKLPSHIEYKLNRQSLEFRKLYFRYLEVMPIMSELNDEMCYVPRQIISAVPLRFFRPIAETAVEIGLFRSINDLFALSYEEIGKLVEKMIKKQARLRTKKFVIAP